jgi:hypothetical protein
LGLPGRDSRDRGRGDPAADRDQRRWGLIAVKHDQIDLAYRLLDLDLVDSEGIRCGKVDDLVIEGDPGELAYVTAIRTGTGALAERFPPRLRGLGRRLFRGETTDVPSRLVDDVDAAVTLSATADELGLGDGDRRLSAVFERRSAS